MTGPGIDRSRASPNHGPRAGGRRPDCIVLHYTGMRDEAAAVDRLCDPAAEVSCHYVVGEGGGIRQLVDDDRRAWHAGRSTWEGETDLNSASLGIEIVNGGHDYGLPAFPDAQVEAVMHLCRNLMSRHAIRSERILAHSDIAPGRKRDPGERFPWRRLARSGIGLWPDGTEGRGEGDAMDVATVQRGLVRLGYGLALTGVLDADTATVLRAFQRRYRPEAIDGTPDADTVARMRHLLRLQGREV